MTSGEAAHVSPNALDRHVQADEHGKIVGLLFQPETRDLERALSFATNALLHAMQAVTRLFRREEFDRTVKSYIDRWHKLEAKLPWKVTLDHFVMVRIHARQKSSCRADLRAIIGVQKLDR
jgi:hypothetical protein